MGLFLGRRAAAPAAHRSTACSVRLPSHGIATTRCRAAATPPITDSAAQVVGESRTRGFGAEVQTSGVALMASGVFALEEKVAVDGQIPYAPRWSLPVDLNPVGAPRRVI